MNKKAIIILSLIFLLIVGTLGLLLYLRSQSASQNPDETNQAIPTPTPTPEPTLEPTPTPDAEVNTSPLNKLDSGEIISPVLYYRGDGISYSDSKGQLSQLKLRIVNGVPEIIEKKTVNLPSKVGTGKILWPPAGNNFIAEQLNGSKKLWSFYNGDAGLYTDLPIQINSLAWSGDGQKIYYVWAGEKPSLNMSNPDGSNYVKLADLFYADTEIRVSPDGKNILFYRTANLGEKNPITLVTSDGKVFKTQVKDGYNSGVLWAPDSRRFVFTRRDPLTQNSTLYLGSILTEEVKNLNLNTNFDRVVWSSDSSLLFVSASKASGSQSGEALYELNTQTYEQKELYSGLINARDLFLSLDGDVLFFHNVNDNSLYGFTLKNSATPASGNVYDPGTIISPGVGGSSSASGSAASVPTR